MADVDIIVSATAMGEAPRIADVPKRTSMAAPGFPDETGQRSRATFKVTRSKSAVRKIGVGGVAVRPAGPGWSRDRHSAVKSWRGIAVGASIALTVPVAFIVLALLLDVGVLPPEPMRHPVFTEILFSEVLLGPVGLAVAGWSAGVRGGVAWALLLITAIPLLSALWVISALMFGGATGSPF